MNCISQTPPRPCLLKTQKRERNLDPRHIQIADENETIPMESVCDRGNNYPLEGFKSIKIIDQFISYQQPITNTTSTILIAATYFNYGECMSGRQW